MKTKYRRSVTHFVSILLLAFSLLTVASPSLANASSQRPPSPPRALKVRLLSTHSIIVSWVRPVSPGGSSAVGYTVHAENDFVVTSCVTTKLTCTINRLGAKREYRIWVLAHNTAGTSHSSSKVYISTVLSAPPPTTNPGQSAKAQFAAWEVKYDAIFVTLESNYSAWNQTLKDVGAGNAWAPTFVSEFSSDAANLGKDLPPSNAVNSSSITTAINNLVSAIQHWVCLGETVNGGNCGGIAWLGYGSQATAAVSAANAALISEVNQGITDNACTSCKEF
jgi:hypothetical protein